MKDSKGYEIRAHGTVSGYRRGCRCDECKTAVRNYQKQYKQSRPPLAVDDPRHGTLNGYVNLVCRCDECKEANRVACYLKWEQRRATPLAADDPRHGTKNGYGNWGCRCTACTKAWAIAARKPNQENNHGAT